MIRQVQDKLLKQSRREYLPKQRLLALAAEGIFFLILLPFIFVTLGTLIDQWQGWNGILYSPVSIVLGVLLMAGGFLFAIWSIYVQFTIGRGTPVPLMATQKLIIQPPYSYCRNPMALGTILMFMGVALLFGSLGAIILALLGGSLLLTYIKFFEEQEMETRFGPAYLAYRQETPFLIPRFWKIR